jgi:hypothetical protein
MIKVSKEDSIIDVIIKIKHVEEKEIVLEFPFGHPLLHNYTSLRILKTNAWEKDLVIITSDITAKKIGRKLGIKYTLINHTDLLEYNYSFSEYCKFVVKNYWREVKGLFKKNRLEELYSPYFQNKKEQKTKIWIFFVTLLVSIGLFIFVFYFAVNKTSVYITPDITIRTAAKNLTFEYKPEESIFQDKNIIALKQITKLVYLNETFGTTGVDESTVTRANWEATFYNELPEKIRLRENTRLQSDAWIVYVTQWSVDIPAAFTDGSGKLIAWEKSINIQAKLYDEDNNFIWTRWNTWTGQLLMLPGLKSDQDKIYAYTTGIINWWTNNFSKILWEDDIKNAKLILEWQLQDYALSQAKKEIRENNKNNDVAYNILEVNDIIQWSNLWITWDEELKVWDKMENFELNGTIKITTYTYNSEQVLNHLKWTIKDTLLDEVEDLRYIDKSSMRIALVLLREEEPLKIKASAEIQASFTHNFLSKKNNYVEKLKYTIAGMDKEDAKKILLNNSKISNVEIETRPFFMKNISSIPNNIEFIVEE